MVLMVTAIAVMSLIDCLITRDIKLHILLQVRHLDAYIVLNASFSAKTAHEFH